MKVFHLLKSLVVVASVFITITIIAIFMGESFDYLLGS